MTKATAKNTSETKTLLVRDDTGSFRVSIPADAKVTFGPIQPKGGWDQTGLVLRIYEAESRQLAAFVNVKTFRDLSLKVERLVVAESGEEAWSIDEGGETQTRKVKRTKKFVEE